MISIQFICIYVFLICMAKTVKQLVYESWQRRSKKIMQLNAKHEKEIERKIAIRDKKEKSNLAKKIDKIERMIQWKKPRKKKAKKLNKTEMLAVLQKYVRLRDSNNDWRGDCICCGVTLPRKWKILIGESELFATWWHYISSQWNATAYDLDNINLQCNSCNNKMHRGWKAWDETLDKYRKNLIHKIGLEKVLNLEVNKSTLVDTWQYLTKENYEYWLAKVNELEREKDLH